MSLEIKVYTAENCQPCRMVKRFLNEAGVSFTELDGSQHIAHLESIGARSLPVTIKGDIVIHGFDLGRLQAVIS